MLDRFFTCVRASSTKLNLSVLYTQQPKLPSLSVSLFFSYTLHKHRFPIDSVQTVVKSSEEGPLDLPLCWTEFQQREKESTTRKDG